MLWTLTRQKEKKKLNYDVIIFAWSPSGQISPRGVLGERFSHVRVLTRLRFQLAVFASFVSENYRQG